MEIFKKLYLKLRPIILPIKEIKKFVRSNAKILDLGCGQGLLLLHLENFSQYTGVDIKNSNYSQNNKVNFINCDCNKYVTNNLEEYDTVLVIDLISFT